MNLIQSLRSWWTVSLLLTAAALTSCGGGMSNNMTGSTGSTTTGTGTTASTTGCTGSCGGMMMTLSDAPGDFISYIVNVVSIQLTRADGTTVSVIPVSTQIDFAQLVNLSEVVSAAQIPSGNYVSASITLDYGNATIVVDNGSGGVTIAPSNIINGSTSMALAAPNPTQVTLTLSLGSGGSFVVSPAAIANLALDFNLMASDAITPSDTNPTTVTVNPVLTASLMPDPSKQIRVRGPLVSVDSTGSSYVVSVRPFFNISGASGSLTVLTTANTTYSINGTSFTGGAGLTQLATLAAGTVTAAYGSFDVSTHVFTASSVLAGSSVAGTTLSTVSATVVARSGNTLTLSSGVLYRPIAISPSGGSLDYGGQVTVTVGPSTIVTENAVSASFTYTDISVGQHVIVSGTQSTSSSMGSVSMGTAMDDTSMGANAFDATSGSVQMTQTTVVGTVTAISSDLVTVNLQTVDGRSAGSLNFAGTGMTTAQDASKSAYTVSIPTALQQLSSASQPAVSQPVRFTGFVSPFGTAPPDFVASALTNFANTRAALFVRWASPGVTAPFATQTATGITISQATLNASAQDVIQVASVTENPALLSTGLQVSPDSSASNPQFAIAHIKSRMIDNFTAFSDFATALATELDGSHEVLQVVADGPYNSSTGVFSADQMVIITND